MYNLKPDERIGVILSLLMAGSIAIQFAFPAWRWLDVQKLDVLSGPSGEPILVDYDRQIETEFSGQWRVKVWRKDDDGGLTPVCAPPTKAETYRPGTKLPDPVTLEWLAYTDPKCYNLLPGSYEIEVIWTINPGAVMERTVKRRDEFRVTP